MKRILTLCVLFLIGIDGYSQFPMFGGKKGKTIKGKIEGMLLDSITGESIAFASIALRKVGAETIVNGVISEDDGKFTLGDVTNGKYDLFITFLGYEDKLLKNVETTLKDPDLDLGRINLSPAAELLDEVQITEKRALFENKVDKIVFNAEDDSSISGGDATDVLRKVPLLSVDLEGNVSLRGSQNVRILINGKPSGMFSANVADALKMFPADQIKKVEVITSPGAKYDGEGSGGIINIITQSKEIEGIAGNINMSVGNRQNNANVGLNIGKGRFGFTANGGVFYSIPQEGSMSFTRTSIPDNNVLYTYAGTNKTERLGFNGSFNAFYDFNAFNAINSNFTLRGFGFDMDGDNNGNFFGQSFNRSNINQRLNSGFDWTTDYTRKFEDSDVQELVFAVQASGNIQNQESQVIETGFNSRNEAIVNDADNLELTAQVDYVHPVGNANKLEIGIKSVIRNIDSDSDFSVQTNRSNVFLYDQDVYAGYLSYNFFFKKLNVVTGLRYEHTSISGNGDEANQVFKNDYDNILPSIAVSKTLSGFRTLKVSYNRRIQRPSLFYINPFINNTDFGNVNQGNPYLDPELTDQIEVGYNTNFLGFTIFSSLYYKINKSLIESVNIQSDEYAALTTYRNVGTNKSVGTNIFINKSLGRINLRGGGDIYSYNAEGIINGEEISNSALSYRLFTNGDISIIGTFKADWFGFFQAPRFTLQGENASFSIFGVGFRKDFKNSSLGIRIIEPFSDQKFFNSDISNDAWRQVSSFGIPFRSVGINFRYKFGKVDFKQRKSKISNTDQKTGEGNQQGGQSGGTNMQ